MPTKCSILGALVLGSTAATALIAPPAQGRTTHSDDVAEEYVVAYDRGTTALRHEVAAAGGTVLDVNRQLGMALVRAVDDDFRSVLDSRSGIAGVTLDHSVGLSQLGMAHRYATERPSAAERATAAARPAATPGTVEAAPGSEPLAARQWDMAMMGATAAGAHRRATGDGVDVGIIDTGIDAGQPDIAPNFDAGRSRNFTTDQPDIDGPCEVPGCVDPVGEDDRGHGTHVAGTIAAAHNGFGMEGVAPDATLVELRAGQDSGYFFLYETAKAITEAGDLGLDVVNMSFYTDPWLYNCDSADDYVAGKPTKDELAQQQLTRRLVGSALRYAHERGVTMVAAAGNEHANLAAPMRPDPYSPGFPPGTNTARVVTRDCIDMPAEGPNVISVGSVGPSGTKADYSNYGLGSIDLTAPGGWTRDRAGTPAYKQPENMILSSYPMAAAMAQGLADENGDPVDPYSVKQCNLVGTCGFYTYLQGTSMAAPHVVGAAALIVQRFGTGSALTGYSLAPDKVAEILTRTARDRPCPPGRVISYAKAERSTAWDARCDGTTQANGLYGAGIVDAAAAVR